MLSPAQAPRRAQAPPYVRFAGIARLFSPKLAAFDPPPSVYAVDESFPAFSLASNYIILDFG